MRNNINFNHSEEILMKNALMLSVLATAAMTASVDAAIIDVDMSKNRLLITDGMVSVEEYLFGDVDSNGQTILHRIADNCDNDDFALKLKLFDLLENQIPNNMEKIESKLEKYDLLSKISPEAASVVMLSKVLAYAKHKDKNGDTALDIAKKRNMLSSHKRCGSCAELLELFENEELNKVMADIANKIK